MGDVIILVGCPKKHLMWCQEMLAHDDDFGDLSFAFDMYANLSCAFDIIDPLVLVLWEM
jgi:hypothetical protein